MFEDRTFENIMAETMTAIKNSDLLVRTDEGSLIYNACAKNSQKIAEAYSDLAIIADNLVFDTMDLDHLISYGSERGIAYSYATAAVVQGDFSQEIPTGTRFSCGNYIYSVTSLIPDTTYSYKMTCETAGTVANTTLGDLIAVDYVADYKGGVISAILTPGEDDEDAEIYRKRIKASFSSIAFAGNKAAYIEFTDKLPGVGGCVPKRRDKGRKDIDVYIIDSNYDAPSASLVNDVQTAIDPTVNAGEGDGLAPIDHIVKVSGVTGTSIAVTATVTYDTGFSNATSKDSIADAISNYFLTIRKAWEENETNDSVVRVARVDEAILSVDGVLDVKDTTLNGSAENIILPYTQVPVIGEVTLNV